MGRSKAIICGEHADPGDDAHGPQLDTEKLIDVLENMRNLDLGLESHLVLAAPNTRLRTRSGNGD